MSSVLEVADILNAKTIARNPYMRGWLRCIQMCVLHPRVYCLTGLLCLCVTPVYPDEPVSEQVSLNERLVLACYQLDVDTVVRSIKAGADVNARFNRDSCEFDEFHDRWTGAWGHVGTSSWTPLLALAASDNYPQPEMALGDVWKDESRADTLLSAIPAEQIQARSERMVTISCILLSHGCEIDAADWCGGTPLYYAADVGKIALVKLLLSHGANPNVRVGIYLCGSDQTTPLHVACDSKEITKLLLEYGADPSARDSNGKTAADWMKLVDKYNSSVESSQESD